MTEIDQTLIIEEGLGALGVICHEVAELRTLCDFTKVPDGENSALIISDPKMGSLLETICHNQALAYSCLFDNGAKRSSESGILFKLRVERVKRVRGLCGDVSMTELSNKGVRNALAHFDEYCLKMIIAHPGGGFVKDIGISHIRELGSDKKFKNRCIRAYFFDIDEMYLFGRTLKLAKLAEEAKVALSAFGFPLHSGQADAS